MKNQKSLFIALAVTSVLCLAGGIYLLVESIRGEGNWALAIGLLLISLGNSVLLIGNRYHKK